MESSIDISHINPTYEEYDNARKKRALFERCVIQEFLKGAIDIKEAFQILGNPKEISPETLAKLAIRSIEEKKE